MWAMPEKKAVKKAVKKAGIGSDAVKAKTGKPLEDWFKILDKAKANEWPHKEIAAWLSDKQGVPGWWCQMLTVEYERARGLREVNQKCDGQFAASASKTLPVAISTLYKAWNDPALRRKWLGSPKMTVRKANENKSIRITWTDGSNVNVYFWNKGPEKSQLSIDHEKLADAGAVQATKAYWSERLAKLAALVQPAAS